MKKLVNLNTGDHSIFMVWLKNRFLTPMKSALMFMCLVHGIITAYETNLIIP